MTWSAAASLLAHLGVAMAIAMPPRARRPEPPDPAVATAEVDVSEVEVRDESGFGANGSTPDEVPARSHAPRAGPERAARPQSRRNVRGAKAARVAARAPHEEPAAQDVMRTESAERQVDARAPVDGAEAQRGAPRWDAVLPAGSGDPLDRVLGMRAEREQAADAKGSVAQAWSARTETTVVVSAPAFADGASVTEGLGAGTGGPGRGPRADRSSPARLGGPVWWWFCPWPREADALPIRHATVKLAVAVTPDGHATAARVIEASPEFGPGARQCAMEHVYVPARDRDGRAAAGTTLPFVVKFDR